MIVDSLAKYISDHGIKQKAIADHLGIAPSSMSALLLGNRRMSADEYVAICDFLDVPYSKFVNQDDEQ